MAYLPRVVDAQLKKLLEYKGAVYIRGPKWCGKTSTGKRQANSCLFLHDPDSLATNMAIGAEQPSLLLRGDKPRLLDEWQTIPSLWDAVRYDVDTTQEAGAYILTGSSTPTHMPLHSGVGRIARLDMRTMSLYESGESTGNISLAKLFNGEKNVATLGGTQLDELAFLVARGGWPSAVTASKEKYALNLAREYVEEIIDSDVSRMDGVNRNALRMRSIMRSYARNIATEASLAAIRADMQENDQSMSMNTLTDYVDALGRAFIVEDLPAWNPVLRSKTAIRTSPTRHFVDPSIGVGALGLSPQQLIADTETFGLFFESLCVRDLRVYVQNLGGRLYHYRDKTGLEADAVIVLDDGRWAPVEIKLGASRAGEGIASLSKLCARVDTDKLGEPAFSLVVTGTGSAYQDKDSGVLVVPITMLAP